MKLSHYTLYKSPERRVLHAQEDTHKDSTKHQPQESFPTSPEPKQMTEGDMLRAVDCNWQKKVLMGGELAGNTLYSERGLNHTETKRGPKKTTWIFPMFKIVGGVKEVGTGDCFSWWWLLCLRTAFKLQQQVLPVLKPLSCSSSCRPFRRLHLQLMRVRLQLSLKSPQQQEITKKKCVWRAGRAKPKWAMSCSGPLQNLKHLEYASKRLHGILLLVVWLVLLLPLKSQDVHMPSAK